MSGTIWRAGRRVVKGGFHMMGLELSRYVGPAPVQRAVKLPAEHNKLHLNPTSGSLPRRPAPFVLVSTNHGTLIVNRNDYKPGGHFGMGFQLFRSSSFDYEEIELAL